MSRQASHLGVQDPKSPVALPFGFSSFPHKFIRRSQEGKRCTFVMSMSLERLIFQATPLISSWPGSPSLYGTGAAQTVVSRLSSVAMASSARSFIRLGFYRLISSNPAFPTLIHCRGSNEQLRSNEKEAANFFSFKRLDRIKLISNRRRTLLIHELIFI